jgi:glucose-6-phosphate 1-dehydrogenase
MVQNHLLQLLTLVAMEPPIAFTADSVRDRKMDALLSVQPIAGAVRGQYGAGWVNGSEVPGYRGEAGVDPASRTETFVAMRLHLDSWRWAGVPFYLRTGKRLPKRTTEIAIQFRRPPLEIFRRVTATPVSPNLLVVNVQPDEGISIRFEAKLPGTRMQLAPVRMNFRYGQAFGGEVPEAYETLLLDAMLGDATLFARSDFVEASWSLITPLHEAWAAATHGPDGAVAEYEAGGWGPAEAAALMERDGRRWRTL